MARHEPYTGPLPTIAHDRALGVTAIHVFCAGLYCGHSSEIELDRLALSDDLPVIHIPRERRFVCSRCGSRKVEVRSKWSQPAGRGF
jgi:hypothetical protein